MKQFFIFLFMVLFAAATWATPPALQPTAPDPDAFTFSKNADKYSLSTPFDMDRAGASPLAGTRGITPWQPYGTGRVRFVSCIAGIKNVDILLTAVQIDPGPDKTFPRPRITTDFPARELHILYPVVNPLPAGKTQTTAYTGITYFPIVFRLTQQARPITIDVLVNDTPLSLVLDTDQSFETGLCGALNQSLLRVPVPTPSLKINAQASSVSPGRMDIYANLPDAPAYAGLQIENDFTFTVDSLTINGTQARFALTTDRPVEPGTVLHLKLLTDVGWFDTDITLSPDRISADIIPEPGFRFITGGLLLALFSPLWIVLFRTSYKNKRAFLKTTRVRLAVATPILFVAGFSWVYALPEYIIYPPYTVVIAALVGGALFFMFVSKPIFSLALILILALPKPYLTNTLTLLAKSDVITIALTTAWWTFCLVLPFLLAVFIGKIWTRRVRLKNIHKFVLNIPFIFWTLWVFVGYLIFMPVNNTHPTFERPTREGTTLILFDKPEGISNFWQNLITLKMNPFSRLQQTGRLTVARGDIFAPYATGVSRFPAYILMNAAGQRILIQNSFSTRNLDYYLKIMN